MLQKGGPT